MGFRYTPLVSALIAATALTACGTTNVNEKANKNIERANATADRQMEAHDPSLSVVSESEGLYLDKEGVRITEDEELPDFFDSPYSLAQSDPMTLRDLSRMLQRDFDVRVEVGEDALTSPSMSGGGQSSNDSAGTTASSGGGGQGGGSMATVTPHYDGTLAGFLDYVSAEAGVYWQWEEGTIRIRRYETSRLSLSALAGSANIASNIEGGGDAGDSSQTSALEAQQLSVWEDVQTDLSSFLSDGGSLSVSQTMGVVVVRDTPAVVDRAEAYIEQLNEELSQQVVVRVEVYELALEDTSNYGVDWDAVYSEGDRFGFSFSGNALPTSAATNLTASIIEPTSPANGTQGFVNALRTQGDLSTVTTANLASLNGQPVPLRVTDETTYLASTSSGSAELSGTTSTRLEPGTVESGFMMNLLPRVQSADDIMLQYSMSISSLLGIDEVESGNQSIQTPRTTAKEMSNRVSLGNGETLMLAGFERATDKSEYRGVGGGLLALLGFYDSNESSKTKTVILLTPYLMET